MRTALIAALILLAPAANAVTNWNIQPTSKLGWTVPFNKQPVTGTFEKWNGKIAFDPENLKASSIAINIDLASVNSQDANRDGTLKGPEFFNTSATPTATFTSTEITKTSQGYVASGNLSLAGITKPLAVPFTLTMNGDKAIANGTFSLSRNAFGIGKGQWQSATEIADLVTVNFSLNATSGK